MPDIKKVRITGIELGRALDAAGGLWMMRDVCRVLGEDWRWLETQRRVHKDFPRAAGWRCRDRGEPRWPLYAGEDIVDYLERHEMYGRAEIMVERIMAVRLKMRRDSKGGGVP